MQGDNNRAHPKQEQGTANPSLAYSLLSKYTENEKKGIPNTVTIEDIQGASGSVFIAGSNTVSQNTRNHGARILITN